MRTIVAAVLLAMLSGLAPTAKADEPVPSTKECVDGRQTEDPMSPPCVGSFDGDNGGATSTGVTRDEIRVLLYLDAGCQNSECPPTEDRYRIIDFNRPVREPCPRTYPVAGQKCDYMAFRLARGFTRYFNDRFMTYGRRVHLYAYISGATTAAQRKADAAGLFDALKPFAVLDQAVFQGYNDAFVDAMAARGVTVFATPAALTETLMARNDPMVWSFWPSVERQATAYADYVCSRIAALPARHAGSPELNGRQRRFGLLYTTDPSRPELHAFREVAKEGLRACGAFWAAEGTFTPAGWDVRVSVPLNAIEAVRKFQESEVTTVLWLGGVTNWFSRAASAHGYFPEIVLAPDFHLETNASGRVQDQTVWRNAWGLQTQLRMDGGAHDISSRALDEGSGGATDEERRYAPDVYRDFFQLFTAVQLAGPLLAPESVRDGFRALPAVSSTDPYRAACSYPHGDFGCVDDAMEVWWDPTGSAPDQSAPGCMRMVQGGVRRVIGDWPVADEVFGNPSDPCTAYDGSRKVDPSPSL